MKRLTTLFLVFALFSLPLSAAVKIVECEDAEGNKTFQITCPPGTTLVSEKQISTGGASATSSTSTAASAGLSATLYIIPKCETCKLIKKYLQERQVSVTEKDVENDVDLQNELTALAGVLKVPVTVISGEVVNGYDVPKLKTALTNAGYVEPPPEDTEGEESEALPDEVAAEQDEFAEGFEDEAEADDEFADEDIEEDAEEDIEEDADEEE